ATTNNPPTIAATNSRESNNSSPVSLQIQQQQTSAAETASISPHSPSVGETTAGDAPFCAIGAAAFNTPSTSSSLATPAPPSTDDHQRPAAAMTRPRSSTTGDASASSADAATAPSTATTFPPSIRLSAYYDPRSTRP